MQRSSPVTLRPRIWTPTRGQAGSTIAEALVGTAIAAFGITALCVASANCLGITRAHREALVANQCLQQRTERYRAANWKQVTDAETVRSLLQESSVNDGTLAGQSETVTVSAYPTVSPAVTPIVVTRDASGNTTVVSQPSGYSLRNSLAVKINFQEMWTSAQGGRTRSRENSTVVSLGGLLH